MLAIIETLRDNEPVVAAVSDSGLPWGIGADAR